VDTRIAGHPADADTGRAMPPSILIVDDHRTFRNAARALLEADGFDVVGEAPDAADGLARSTDLAPDVVLVDVRLPDRDGFALAADIVAAGTAVVLTSSSDDPAYPARAEASGAAGFVHKHDLDGAALRRLLA
jgi:DNA-binding NarL/FixJ family response regulator